MNTPDYAYIEQRRIDRAVKAAGARYGLVQVNGVAMAATQPQARVTIEIDPVTGWPLEVDVSGSYFPGDVPSDGDKELS